MAPLNLVLLGAPGAGKGTQAERLKQDFQIAHISAGEMLRTEVAAESELGQRAQQYLSAGELVPDELIIGMIEARLGEPDAEKGFLLDGFPRNEQQADALERALGAMERPLLGVILIDVPNEEIIRRLAGRRVCVKGGHVYHVEFDPPKHEDTCDQDGSRLIQREDDREETVRRRLEVFNEQTAPLIEYYTRRDLLRRVDGTRPPAAVHDSIRATIAGLQIERSL